MQLLLVRHAESLNNLLFAQTGGWTGRVSDPVLTERGEEQAARLAQFFADGRLPRPDLLVTSLMRRAVQTAAPISEALELPLQGDLSLHELNTANETAGDAGAPHPGSPASELVRLAPRLVLPGDADETGWYHRPYETPADGWRRARHLIDQFGATYGGTDHVVALVTHGWFGQFLLRAFIGWPASDDGDIDAWFELNNTGTVLVQCPALWGDRPVDIRWVNRTDHLPPELLTW